MPAARPSDRTYREGDRVKLPDDWDRKIWFMDTEAGQALEWGGIEPKAGSWTKFVREQSQ